MALAAGLAWAWYRPFRVSIEGRSMEPELLPGDWALAVRARSVRRGDVVVARPPSRPGLEVVKRVTHGPGELAPSGSVLGPDDWFLAGDRPEASTDSRHFGPVPRAAVVGRVVAVYGPSSRRRLVRRGPRSLRTRSASDASPATGRSRLP